LISALFQAELWRSGPGVFDDLVGHQDGPYKIVGLQKRDPLK
jgi:hypothetical protein